MLSPRQEMMIDRCSSGSGSGSGSASGSISGGSYNSARMEWSTRASARYPSPRPATPRAGAGGVDAAAGHRHGPAQAQGTIRVIHIFAPKIIKTDVANFKHLVQKLTGNSSTSKRFGGSKGRGSKRGGLKALAPSSSRGQQILSHYRNASQIFASSNRVEYVIPRSSAPGIRPKPTFLLGPPIANTSRSGMDFYRRENFDELLMDIKPVVSLREPSFINGGSTSTTDQSCSQRFLPVDTNSSRSGNILNTHQSKDTGNMFFNRNSTGAGTTNVLKHFNGTQLQWQGNRGALGGMSSSSPRQSLVTDPFQSLSGYKEKLTSPPLKSSTSSSTTAFPSFDERTRRFSDMEILTGLVQPGPSDRDNLPDAPPTWPTHHPNYSSSSNSPSDFNFATGQLSNASNLCRFSVQSPLHGGVSQLFENF